MNNKAQVLISIFLLLLMIGIFSGTLARLWPQEIQTRQYENNGLAAFYLSQAGIERAKIEAARNPGLSGWQLCEDDSDNGCWYNDVSGGLYKFNVTNLGGNRRFIISRGVVRDSSNRTLAQRELEVIIDIGTRTQEEWSWRER